MTRSCPTTSFDQEKEAHQRSRTSGCPSQRVSSWRKPGSRLLTGADSPVGLGCLLKGRSVRSFGPDYIGLDLFGSYMYVASEDNPADDGTRNKSIREPTCETPFYLQEALLGNFAPLDAELKKVGLDYVSLLDLPPLTSIRQSLGPVLEPAVKPAAPADLRPHHRS